MLPSSTFAFGLAIGNGRRYDEEEEEGDQLGRGAMINRSIQVPKSELCSYKLLM
jgi:hypothetical protein